MTTPTLLVPVTFPDPGIYPLDDVTVDSLDGFDVVLLGYWECSPGEDPEATRSANETDVEAVLYEVAAALSHAGANTDVHVHFAESDPERRALQRYVVEEFDPDGVLLADHLPSLHNVLVPLRDDRHIDGVVEVVRAFDAEDLFVVELYHAVADEAAVEAGEAMLDAVADRLLSADFTETDVERTVEVVDDVGAELVDRARAHNVVVLGETEREGTENRLFGPVSDRLHRESETPVLVVR